MSILDSFAKKQVTVGFASPLSLRGMDGFSLTQPVKLIFNLTAPYDGPLVDLTNCRFFNLEMLEIQNIGAPAACGILLARSSPTSSCSNLTLKHVKVTGKYSVASLLLIGSEMVVVQNSYFQNNVPGSSAIRIVASNRNPENVALPLVVSPFGPVAEGSDGSMASVSQSVVRFEACGATVDAGGGSNTVRIGQGTASITWVGGSLSANVAGSKSAFKIGEPGGTKCQFISIMGRPQIESPADNGVRRLENGILIDNVVEGFQTELGITSANTAIKQRVPELIKFNLLS